MPTLKSTTSSALQKQTKQQHQQQQQRQRHEQNFLPMRTATTGTRNSTASVPSHANVSITRYKTELCRPFTETGQCKYGDKCQFSHGLNELRLILRHPKYKTEYCRTFHTTGYCPYGPRCHFIHDIHELRPIVSTPQSNIRQHSDPWSSTSSPKSDLHIDNLFSSDHFDRTLFLYETVDRSPMLSPFSHRTFSSSSSSNIEQ